MITLSIVTRGKKLYWDGKIWQCDYNKAKRISPDDRYTEVFNAVSYGNYLVNYSQVHLEPDIELTIADDVLFIYDDDDAELEDLH